MAYWFAEGNYGAELWNRCRDLAFPNIGLERSAPAFADNDIDATASERC
jgi:hypothetical protein